MGAIYDPEVERLLAIRREFMRKRTMTRAEAKAIREAAARPAGPAGKPLPSRKDR